MVFAAKPTKASEYSWTSWIVAQHGSIVKGPEISVLHGVAIAYLKLTLKCYRTTRWISCFSKKSSGMAHFAEVSVKNPKIWGTGRWLPLTWTSTPPVPTWLCGAQLVDSKRQVTTCSSNFSRNSNPRCKFPLPIYEPIYESIHPAQPRFRFWGRWRRPRAKAFPPPSPWWTWLDPNAWPRVGLLVTGKKRPEGGWLGGFGGFLGCFFFFWVVCLVFFVALMLMWMVWLSDLLFLVNRRGRGNLQVARWKRPSRSINPWAHWVTSLLHGTGA